MSRFRFSAVIFDLDGTLADSLADIAGSMNHALLASGLIAQPLERYRALVGEGLDVLAQALMPPSALDLLPTVLRDYRAHYALHFDDQSSPYPGIPELLDQLSGKVALAVLSNKRHDFTVTFVERMFARWRFEVVRGERPPTPRKPHPAGALEVAAALGVAPSACAFVGDTRVDMETATQAGMFAVGALWGFRDRDELMKAGAQALISHPLDLVERLG